MPGIYIIAILLVLAGVGLTMGLLGSRRREGEQKARCEEAEKRIAELNARMASLAADLRTRETEATGLRVELTRSEERVRALEEKAEHDRQELEKLQASFRAEFRNLANDLLEQKSAQFKQTNKEAMDALLKPFKDNISDFRERVEKIYSEENEQRGILKSEIRNLLDLNRHITEETANLTNALRGNSKVQGDWGEMILATILERSGLVKGIHYTCQENLKDEVGNNLRPDVILHLPDRKRIVIDSKVSLTAFVGYTAADDAETRGRFLREHLLSVRRHVEELGAKRYQELLDSPDFVIMFVPNEPAFLTAIQNDAAIWSDAYNKKVIVSSPTNLFALLKIVDDLWQRDAQNRNALEIADAGGKLYDKFVGFLETLETLGKNISSVSDSYQKAMGQLSTGSGNLIGRTEKLRKLGVKASKSMPPRFEAAAMEMNEEESVRRALSGETVNE